MPRTTAIRADFELQIKGLEKALSDGTSLTKAEIRKQLKEHRKVAKAMNQDIPAGARKASKAVQKNVGAMRKAFEGIQGTLGSTGSRMTALGEAAAAFGPAGVAGLAVTGFVVALGGLAAGAVKAGQAMIALVDEAADLVRELDDLNALMGGELFTTETEQNILNAANAITAMNVSGSLLKITVADDLTPAVETLTGKITALNLALNDAGFGSEAFAKGLEVVTSAVGDFLRSDFAAALHPTTQGLGNLLDITDEYADEADELADAVSRQAQMAAIADVNQRNLAEALKLSAKGQREGAKAAREHATALREMEKGTFALVPSLEEILEADDAATTSIDENHEWLRQRDHARNQQAEKEAEAIAAARVGAVVAAAQTIASIVSQQAEASRAAALFQIAVDTAAGIMQTIGQWGLPWGLIPAAAVAAAGAIQAGVVSSEPAPTFHAGGLVGPGTRPANDERIRTLTGEGQVGVVTRQAMDDMNRGRGAGGGVTVIQQKLSHRVLDEQIAENSQMTTSSLRRFVRTSKRAPVGKRRRTRSR